MMTIQRRKPADEWSKTIVEFQSPHKLRELCIPQGGEQVSTQNVTLEQQKFKIRLAASEDRVHSASLLIQKMYSWRGYQTSEMDEDPNRITLLAFDKDKIVGTLTLGLDSKVGLLVDELYKPEVDSLRAQGAAQIAANPLTKANRNRIEHAQVISPADMPRFAQLGVIASMEPPHAVEDKAWAEERLGPQRILGAYAWRTLRLNGARLTFNADTPGSDHSIFYGLHAAITRRDKALQPAGGWYPAQRLTVEEAIRAYTVWSAYAAFREQETGILAPGRWADLTVMDIDPFALAGTAPEQILRGRIMLTVVEGRVVFER